MKKSRILVAIVIMVLLFGWAIAQESFDWMPKGGTQLLFEILDQCPTCDDPATLVTAERTPEEWQSYFADQGALEGLTEQQVNTLTTYLAINFPIPELSQEFDMEALPIDGRQLLLETCQNCHFLIGLLEERTIIGWRYLFSSPNHVIIPLTNQEWETLAHYLTFNTPIPEDQIPEDVLEMLKAAPPSF